MADGSPAASAYRAARRFFTDPRTVGVAQAAPRTAAFMARSWARSRQSLPDAAAAAAQPSLGLAAQVLLDEVLIASMKNPRLFPSEDDYRRAGEEIRAAHVLFETQGWLDDPERYHDARPAPSDATVRRRRVLGQRFEHLTFPSGYEPHRGEPGGERWLAHERNRTAHAFVLRHPGPDRPWLVCIHGFGTGRPLIDFRGFRAPGLHRTLGLNLLLPVLPLHGPRQRPGAASGEGFMSIDLLDSLHGLAQAAWDVRAAIAWARAAGGGAPVGVYGLSLGGYVAALVASLEDDLACAIAGIPATDLPDLYRRHSTAAVRRRALEAGALGAEATAVHRVVSPLVLAPKLARGRRYVFAGLGDRMSTSDQARRLWRHWDQPRIAWYPGGHVGFWWASNVTRFVTDALVESGMTTAADQGAA